jgi:parvulin-like peptidyl-prolyl isomerase
MLRKERALRRIIPVIVAAALAIAAGCGEKDEGTLVIAMVDTVGITVADFERVSAEIDEKYLPETDDLEGKKVLLRHMINKEIMALKASAMGYEKEQWFIDIWERMKGPFLIAQLMDQEVAQKVKVSEEDIDEYYRQMHSEYTLSQITATSEDEIAEIRERAIAGEDFAELARNYSLDLAASQGGFIGANAIGNMHWWIEEVLFEMEAGDISPPLSTSTGWAIIKLHSKRHVEPAHDKEWAAKRVRAIKEKKGMDQLKAQVEKDIGLQFFSDAVNIAYDALPEEISLDDVINHRITRDNAPRINIPAQFKDMLLVQYSDGSYTLGDFEEIYYTIGLPERPTKKHGREFIVLTMHKIVFDKILPAYAEQTAKVLEVPEVKKRLDNQKEMLLVHNLYMEQIEEEVVVTSRDIQDYYNENLDILKSSEMRDFSVIIVSDAQTASEVQKEALGGKNFVKLIKNYSADKEAVENDGRTGLHIKGNVPEFDEVAFELDGPGSVSPPFKTPRGWAVIKLEEVQDERMPSLDEASSAIKKTLLEIRYEELLNEKLEKWSEDYVIEIDESALEKAELKRTKL